MDDIAGIVGQRLTLEAFRQLSGYLAGYPFVKVVVERPSGRVHFINNRRYQFHSDYVAEQVLQTPKEELDKRIDEFNQTVYLSDDRPYYFGTLALHRKGERFFTLETVEVDSMDQAMVLEFYRTLPGLRAMKSAAACSS